MKDLNQAFSAVCKYKDFISDFHTPAGTQYLITDPVILQLVASQFRNEENGLFSVPENERMKGFSSTSSQKTSIRKNLRQ